MEAMSTVDMRKVNGGATWYVCTLCGRYFSTHFGAVCHVIGTHKLTWEGYVK